MVRLKIAYWEFDFEAVCPTLDHDLLSQAHITIIHSGKLDYIAVDTNTHEADKMRQQNTSYSTASSCVQNDNTFTWPTETCSADDLAADKSWNHGENDSIHSQKKNDCYCVKPVLNWTNVCLPEHTSDTSTNYDSFLN